MEDCEAEEPRMSMSEIGRSLKIIGIMDWREAMKYKKENVIGGQYNEWM